MPARRERSTSKRRDSRVFQAEDRAIDDFTLKGCTNPDLRRRDFDVLLARRALEVAGDDPGILAIAALALAYFGEDVGAMMALVDRALTLNPSFARGWL